MAGKMVVCEVSSGVARIILNKPPVNALNLEMIKDVVTAFEIAGKDEGIRAVVLTSAVSKAFSAGPQHPARQIRGKSSRTASGTLRPALRHPVQSGQTFHRSGRRRSARWWNDDGHLLRCHTGGTKRDVWVSGDRRRRYSSDTFHAPPSHRRPPPSLRTVVFRTQLRRRRRVSSRPCQQGGAGRRTCFLRAIVGRNICWKISCCDAPRPRCIYAPERAWLPPKHR